MSNADHFYHGMFGFPYANPLAGQAEMESCIRGGKCPHQQHCGLRQMCDKGPQQAPQQNQTLARYS